MAYSGDSSIAMLHKLFKRKTIPLHMLEVVYNPQWFYGKDIVIDLISVCVLLVISIFSVRYDFVMRKNRNYLHLASSFFIISLAFLAKILTYFVIYNKKIQV